MNSTPRSPLQDYIENICQFEQHEQLPPDLSVDISPRAVALSEQIAHWHNTRPVPDRWKPVLLGRTAARFGSTRELTAVALQHAGWRELRKAKHGASYWLPPTLLPNEEP